MTDFRVTWSIDVSAETAEDAASAAAFMLFDPASMPPIFEVRDPNGVVSVIEMDGI